MIFFFFYERTRKGWPFNIGDCLIEGITWTGLTNSVHIKFLQSIFHYYLCVNLIFNLPLWNVKTNVNIISIVCLWWEYKAIKKHYCMTSDNVFSNWLSSLVTVFDKTLYSPRATKHGEYNLLTSYTKLNHRKCDKSLL